MNPANSCSWLASAAVCTLATLVTPVSAQITPDATLPNNSIVFSNGEAIVIEGGTAAGSNLFHSFQDFSIPSGSEALFNNAISIENIITRVTGGNLSDIDGLIRANGTANLFLINPNGIQFGPNARLDIGGSFLASSAERVLFDDGSFYSATEPNAPPLLTLNVPIGLQMGTNPGRIQVRGTGHNLALIPTSTNAFPPFTREDTPSGLTVQPGRTLALVGGDIFLEGGQLLAPKGRIEIGSVYSSSVSISQTPSGFALGYESATDFGDLQLSQQAAVDASGAGGGGIYLTGRQISLLDGSVALIQNQEATPAGMISAIASESLELIGTIPDGTVRSSLNTETDLMAAGNSGDIQVSTGRLLLDDGGQLISRTFGTGKAGNITVEASDSIEILGTSPLNSQFFSSIFAIGAGGSFGNAGDISISTGRLTILDGGIISAGSFGDGAAGSLTVRASESVELMGRDPIFESPSDINVGAFQSGNAGNLTIDTQRLLLRDGGIVRASTIGNGNAGSITVNVSGLIEISGESSIESSTNFPETINIVFGEGNSNPTGQAGGVTVNAERLIVRDGGEVNVQNIGEANGGRLEVNANSILLDNQGRLTTLARDGLGGSILLDAETLEIRNGGQINASSQTSQGGDIQLQVSDTLGLHNQGEIVANAQEAGRGGNITIAASNITLTQDSSIVTNARGTATGGELRLTGDRLSLSGGSVLSATTRGSGNAGNIFVQVGDVDISGIAIIDVAGIGLTPIPSLITIGAFPGSSGGGGNVTVISDRIRITDGGLITAGTAGLGASGDVEIVARESLEVSGVGDLPAPLFGVFTNHPSRISTSSLQGAPAGSTRIQAPMISVTDGGILEVNGSGGGSAGNLEVVGDRIVLENNGSLQAQVASGSQGNLTLNARDLLLSNGSTITTNATNDASGGNLTINSDSIVVRENSQISANAVVGTGGNIEISTSGLFVTPDSQLTASSEFGVDGIITVKNPIDDRASGLVALEANPLNPNRQIQNDCAIALDNRFAITGNGGLPEDPTEFFRVGTVWRDTRLGEVQSHLTPSSIDAELEEFSRATEPLVEATGWRTNSRGQIELIVASGNPSQSPWQPHPECESRSQESANSQSSIR